MVASALLHARLKFQSRSLCECRTFGLESDWSLVDLTKEASFDKLIVRVFDTCKSLQTCCSCFFSLSLSLSLSLQDGSIPWWRLLLWWYWYVRNQEDLWGRYRQVRGECHQDARSDVERWWWQACRRAISCCQELRRCRMYKRIAHTPATNTICIGTAWRIDLTIKQGIFQTEEVSQWIRC